ncbi:MAG: hypothetical protein WA984_18500, partial [Phormidesmis sp.]
IKSVDERTLLRHSLNAIESSDQEQTMQKLLNVIPRTRGKSFALPQRFDARAADSRIALVALSALHPRDLKSGKLIDVANLIESHSLNAFRKIISVGTKATHGSSNRILLPSTSQSVLKELVGLIEDEGVDSQTLRSHGIDDEAAEHILNKELDDFLSRRSRFLEGTVNSFGSRLAAWDMNDRPSISYILRQTGDDS